MMKATLIVSALVSFAPFMTAHAADSAAEKNCEELIRNKVNLAWETLIDSADGPISAMKIRKTRVSGTQAFYRITGRQAENPAKATARVEMTDDGCLVSRFSIN